jgi:hypothetical protein
MKLALALAILIVTLNGCVVVPVAPYRARYVAPGVVVPAPVIVVRPWYYRRWGF